MRYRGWEVQSQAIHTGTDLDMRYRGLGSSITGNTQRDRLRYEISGVGKFYHRQIHRGTDLDIRYPGVGSSITGKYTEGQT